MHVAAAASFPYAPPFAPVNPHAMAAVAMAAAAATSSPPPQPNANRAMSLSPGTQTVEDTRGMKRRSLTPTLRSGAPSCVRDDEKMSHSPKVPKCEALTPRSELATKLDVCHVGKRELNVVDVGGGSPNFANIYAFFAKMFDPVVEFDAIKGVRDQTMSPLDKEVIKLLMSNLEFNIANTAFRQRLLDTYQQQLRRSSQQTVA